MLRSIKMKIQILVQPMTYVSKSFLAFCEDWKLVQARLFYDFDKMGIKCDLFIFIKWSFNESKNPN